MEEFLKGVPDNQKTKLLHVRTKAYKQWLVSFLSSSKDTLEDYLEGSTEDSVEKY